MFDWKKSATVMTILLSGLMLMFVAQPISWLLATVLSTALSAAAEAHAVGTESRPDIVKVETAFGAVDVAFPKPATPALAAVVELLKPITAGLIRALGHPVFIAALLSIELIALAYELREE